MADRLLLSRCNGKREHSMRVPLIGLSSLCGSVFVLQLHYLGRRIHVSLVRTSYGGACCYCSHSTSRSLCCFSLNGSCNERQFVTWFQCPLSLWSEGTELGGQLSLASILSKRIFSIVACRSQAVKRLASVVGGLPSRVGGGGGGWRPLLQVPI